MEPSKTANNTVEFHDLDLVQLEKLGLALADLLHDGDVVLLKGDLGAGKTTFTGFIAKGLGVDPEIAVTSPSFALMHEYHARLSLYHLDLYRLHGEDDVEAAGLLEYMESNGVSIIEWPERLCHLTPEDRLEISLTPSKDAHRNVSFYFYGQQWQERREAVSQLL